MKKLIIIILTVILVPAVFAASLSFSEINALDCNGNNITSDIFKDYKITMINCFTTWCRYCIREMPDLEKLSKNLPDGCNIIAVCCDAFESEKKLISIIDKYELSFPVVMFTYEDIEKIFAVRGYPTTLFVDSSGKIVNTIEGCPQKPFQTYTAYLKKLTEK